MQYFSDSMNATLQKIADVAQLLLEMGVMPSTFEAERKGKSGGHWDIANKYHKSVAAKMADIIRKALA